MNDLSTAITPFPTPSPTLEIAIDQEAILKALNLDPRNPATQATVLICQRYGLDPVLKHVIPIKGQVYITRDGLIHLAHRSGVFDGMEVVQLPDSPTHYIARCTVWRKDMTRPFSFQGRYPKKGGNTEYAVEMAEKVAVCRSLRHAFAVGLCSQEELWEDQPQYLPEKGNPTTTALPPAVPPAAPVRRDLIGEFQRLGESYDFNYKGDRANVVAHITDLLYGDNPRPRRPLSDSDIEKAMGILSQQAQHSEPPTPALVAPPSQPSQPSQPSPPAYQPRQAMYDAFAAEVRRLGQGHVLDGDGFKKTMTLINQMLGTSYSLMNQPSIETIAKATQMLVNYFLPFGENGIEAHEEAESTESSGVEQAGVSLKRQFRDRAGALGYDMSNAEERKMLLIIMYGRQANWPSFDTAEDWASALERLKQIQPRRTGNAERTTVKRGGDDHLL